MIGIAPPINHVGIGILLARPSVRGVISPIEAKEIQRMATTVRLAKIIVPTIQIGGNRTIRLALIGIMNDPIMKIAIGRSATTLQIKVEIVVMTSVEAKETIVPIAGILPKTKIKCRSISYGTLRLTQR